LRSTGYAPSKTQKPTKNQPVFAKRQQNPERRLEAFAFKDSLHRVKNGSFFAIFHLFSSLRSTGYAPSKTQKLTKNQPVFAQRQRILNKLLSMRTVIFLVQKEFLQIFRNKTMSPLSPDYACCTNPSAVLSLRTYEIKNLALTVIDHDLSPLSRQPTAKIAGSGHFQNAGIYFSGTEADASMERDEADMIIKIPANFERDMVRQGQSADITHRQCYQCGQGRAGAWLRTKYRQRLCRRTKSGPQWRD
jgi:hypothetical protein